MPQRKSSLHRVLYAVVAFAALALCLGGCSGPEARRASHMKRGEQYLHDGKLEKAQIEFRSVLQISPADVTARVMLGRVAEKQGSIREAFGNYREAVDLDPDNPVARANLARIYMFAEEPETALELVEPALRRYPNDPELLVVRGAARQELRDTPEAVEDARLALRVAPQNENAVALLASLYMKTGDGAKAVELLKSTLKAMPSSTDLRQILANVYAGLDEPELAEAQLLEVVRIAPKEFPYRLKLAQFYQHAKRLDDAQRVLKQAADELPDNDAAKLAYVEYVSTVRSPQDGQRILAQFIRREPHNYDLQLGFGALQLKGGDANGALVTYRRVVAQAGERPQAITARNRIASILIAQGQSAEALALVTEVLQKSPRDSDALIMRGNIELERNDSAAAIADLRAVLRDQPEDVPILRTLARAHLANGEPALAEESLRDAIKAAPKNVGVRVDLAQLLMESNRLPAGLAILEESVIEAPTSLEAREALASAYLRARDFPMAARAAEDLKVVAPKRALGWYLAGVLAQSQNRFADAELQFEKGLELEPGSADLIAALVRLEVSRGRVEQAFERARAAIAADPRSASKHNMLGELLLATKDYPKAIEELSLATQLDSKSWLPYRNLALAQIASNDLKAATHTYETALAQVGLSSDLAVDLAALYERQQRVDDAIRLYRSLHDRRPRLTVIANNLAMLLVTYRKDEVSLNEAQQLTTEFDHSDNASLLDTQGWVRFKCGDLAEALPELEAAAARQPKARIVRYHLGMAELQAKQFAKARTNLESALEGNPTFVGSDEARLALAKLRG